MPAMVEWWGLIAIAEPWRGSLRLPHEKHMDVIVIGAGVAGVAAAVAARKAGATVQVVEQSAQVGGVAVSGHHLTICGLSPIDATTPELIEPQATAWWIPRLTNGVPFRRGRVWLWPTTPDRLASGLRTALDELAIPLLTSCVPTIDADGNVRGADQCWQPRAVIDASGSAWWNATANTVRSAIQCGAWRAELELTLANTPANRRAALRRIAHLSPGIAFEPCADNRWQLSLDIIGDAHHASACMAEAARLISATVISHTSAIAERDVGGYAGIGLRELFSCTTRGLAWAAWPSEVHDANGVHWQWPAGDRHGCPPSLVKPLHAPDWLWCCGKGLAAAPEAAAALRVIGTGLALGNAVGTLVTTT